MKRSIYLEGEIGLKFGREHSFYGDSVRDALRLIQANNPDFKKYLIACQEVDLGFHVQVGTNEIETPLECLLSLQEGDIIITPVAAGSKSGGAKILTAVAIAALMFAMPGSIGALMNGTAFGATAGSTAAGIQGFAALTAASLAVNLAITGIQQLMAPDPSVDEQDEGYLFNGSQQNIVEGMPVPLLYGELRVPGHPVSFEVITENTRVTSSQTFMAGDGQVISYDYTNPEDPNSPANLAELSGSIEAEVQRQMGLMFGLENESAKPPSSQDALFTDIISEGPIYGLVDGGNSVYLNEDPAQTEKQSFIRASETPVDFIFTNGSTSVTIDKNGYDKSIQIDSSGTKYIAVKNYLSRSSTVAITNSANTKVVQITAASAFFSATDVYDSEAFTSSTVIRLLDSNSITIFEGYVLSRTSSTVAICIPLIGAELNTSLSSGTYTVVKDIKLQIASVATDQSTLTLSATFPGTTGTYKCDFTGTDYGKVTLEDSITNGSKYDSFSLQFRTGTLFQPAFSDAGGTGVGVVAIPQGASFDGTIDRTSADSSQATVEYQGQSAAGFGLTAAQAEQVDEIRVAFAYPQIWNRSPSGEQKVATVRYTASLAIKKDSASAFSSYQEIKQNWTHTGQSNAPRIFEQIINLRQYQPFYDFKLKIVRTTNSDQAYNFGTDTTNSKYTTASTGTINSLSSVIKENLSYPLTAMAKVRVNSKQFSSPPSRTYHCRGLKVKVPSNYITREEGENGVATYNRNVSTGAITSTYQNWDGNFRAEKIYTNNPAWVFYDILTNNRYGLGEWLQETEIDKYALYRIARYCDELVDDGAGGEEPRFTTNVYFTQATDAYKVVKDLASIFRSMIYWLDGQIYTVADQPADPVYNFSKANVIDGAFSYETTGSKTRANQIVVTWNNPKANYKLENLIVEDRQNIIKTGRLISEEASAFGATSEGQALRYGRWKLWTAVNQTEVVSFKTAINAAFLAPGDIINIQDADRYPTNAKYSGRVSNTGTRTTTSIPLDRSITLTSGRTYELSVVFTDSVATLAQDSATISSVSYSRGDIIQGASIDTSSESSNIIDDSGNYVDITWKPYTNVETKTVSTSAGTVSSLTVSSAFSVAPSAESIWVLRETIGGVDTFGSKKTYKILSLGESAKNEYAITAVEFYNEKYTAVDDEFTLSTQDPLFAPPLSGATIPAPRNVYIYIGNLDSGSVENDAIFYWDSPTTDGTDLSPEYQFVDYYELVTNVPRTPSIVRVDRNTRSIRGDNLDPGTFTVGVRTVALNGQKSELQKITFTIQDPAQQSVPRAYGMAMGGVSSSDVFITSTGLFKFEESSYIFSPAGYPQLLKEFDGTPTTEYIQDCSGVGSVTYSSLTDDEAAFASHYIMFDASASDPLTLIKFYRDTDLGYSYFYDAGTGNTTHTSNWTSLTGTVSVSANSNTVVGSSTSFTTELEVGDIIKFSSTQAAKVVYIASNTDVRLDKSFTTAISAGTSASRSSFRFDKDKDTVFAGIRNDAGTFKYFPVNLTINRSLAPRFVLFTSAPATLAFDGTSTLTTSYTNLVLTATAEGWIAPEFKITGAGFNNADISQVAETVFSDPTSGKTYTKTLDKVDTYSSTPLEFTVTVRDKADPTNTDKQRTQNLTINMLKDGGAGAAGDNGLKRAEGYLYYQSAGTPSTTPSGIYTWSTGAVSGTNIGTGSTQWYTTPPEMAAGSQAQYYVRRWRAIETTADSTSTSLTIDNSTLGHNFAGVVTFSAGDFQLNGSTITTIDGGNISTDSISLQSLKSATSFSVTNHVFKLATGGISIAGTSFDSTAQFISDHTGDCANVFCQYTGSDADSYALAAVTDAGKAAGFSYGNAGNYGTGGTNYLEICNSADLLKGYQGSSERFKVANSGAITVNNAFTLPTSDGSNGQVLKTNGLGVVTWGTISAGGGGTVTSVGLTAPVGFSVSGSPVTSSGTLALSFATGYSLPTTASQTNWDTAYSWGNHASAGYAALSGANFTGAITSTGDITAYYSSDRRLKDNIVPISNALEKVTQLGGYEFDWNHVSPYEGMHDIGVIAQEVLKVAPEAVARRENDMLAVRYEKLVPLLIEAIKDLKAEIEELKRDTSN